MNPSETPTESTPASLSAGQMLRAAREAQGMHLAMLSVKLKVSVRQLEALEADRHEDFKGLTFVRALAQSVARQLGVDPAPVLAALPPVNAVRAIEPAAIEGRREGLRVQPITESGRGLSRQVLVLAVLMLLGVAALVWWPSGARDAATVAEEPADPAQAAVPMGRASDPEQSPAPGASASPENAAAPVADASAAKAPVQAASAAAAPPAAAAPTTAASAALVLRLQADMWVEVRDGRGQQAVKRMARAGEVLQLNPLAPLFVYVGKADAAELRWQGQPVDLKPHTLNNEARVQIKP